MDIKMKEKAQKEISEALIANAGNKLTNELIAGLQARIFRILADNQSSESQEKKG